MDLNIPHIYIFFNKAFNKIREATWKKHTEITGRLSIAGRKKNSWYNFPRTHGVRWESIGEKAILLMEAQWKRKLNQAHQSPWFLRLTTRDILWARLVISRKTPHCPQSAAAEILLNNLYVTFHMWAWFTDRH